MMQVSHDLIPEVLLIEPTVYEDNRGYFFETFRQDRLDEMLPDPAFFVQENESKSLKGVVRGLHYQTSPHAQAKLVRVVHGKIKDVVVDLRLGSTTFGKHVSFDIDASSKQQVFIPRGFAHGFSVLSDEAIVVYKVDNYYCPSAEQLVLFSDDKLAIDWGVDINLDLVSKKDLQALPLSDQQNLFDFKAISDA